MCNHLQSHFKYGTIRITPPAAKVYYLQGNDQRHLVQDFNAWWKNKVTLEIEKKTQTL